MKKIFSIIVIVIGLITNTVAQELYYLIENFETPESISRWTQTPDIVNKKWIYTYGGQWWVSPTDGPYNPEIPYQGNYNAGIYFPSLTLSKVKLISPVLELEGAKKPTLRFYHCQYEKAVKGPDYLELFFRDKPSSSWVSVIKWATNIASWKDEIYDIEAIAKAKGVEFLTDSFQIAFEGTIGNGYGVYIDSVSVREDTIVQKYVKKTTYSSINYEAIPAGATDIPYEKIVVRVLGNTGDAILDSLTIVPTGLGVSLLDVNSFKLLYTIDDVYAPYKEDTSTVIATASLSGGKVIFTNINQNLDLGDNYLWISASLNSSLQGQTSISFQVPVNGINISDTLFPASIVNLSNHTIKESVFYDDFESGVGAWLLGGNFEMGWPEGTQISSQKNPETPFNGTNILATDLDGGYYPSINSVNSPYYAYSPEVDLTYYINTGLYMHSYFAINGSDDGVIELSVDGGSNWQNIWTSDASSNNSYWTEFYDESISELVKHQPRVQIRFGITHSETTPWPGFSIDNFAIISEKLNTDVGVMSIVDPYNDCIDCGNDTVKVWIKNFAEAAAPAIIPLYYGLWGADTILVRDTLYGGIAKDDSTLFTFSQQANFPKGDFYDKFIVGVDLSGDQDPTNDTLTKPLIIQNNYSSPNFENFEYKGGIWVQSDLSTWDNRNMLGTIDTDPLSPHIWVLSPTGNYRNSDTSWVTSGCYNLKDETRNILRFKYWSDTEADKDGARFEYSVDDGLNWDILEDPVYGAGWGWPTGTVDALGTPGWSGLNEWTSVKALLPEAADSIEKLKFRLLFMSDAVDAQAQGFAFNDFEIFPAPHNIGVSSIISPVNACQGVNSTTVTVRVKNYGYNSLKMNDSVIVGVDFQSEPAFIDTLILTSDLVPGDSVDLIVNTNIDITADGSYNITAYTLIEDDPWYYQSNNDTAHYSFDIWENPVIILADTIGSRQPDTLSILPIYSNWISGYTYLWQPGGITDSIYDISDNGFGDTTYNVLVTGPLHGCTTIDSVKILLLYSDAGVDSIMSPYSSCELLNNELIQVRIKNFGTDSIYSVENDTAKLVVAYQVVGDASIYRDTITIVDPILSGKTILHEFTDHPYDFSGINNYTIKTWAYYMGGDVNSTNDTTTVNITVFGYTPIDLGPDVVVQGLGHTLDAGSSFVNYLWNTEDETQTSFIDASIVNASGKYYVDVVDANGCAGSDTVNVWFKIRDVQPYDLASPQTSCNRIGNSDIKFQIRNVGTDTIQVTDSIIYSYQIDGGTVISEKKPPSTKIVPGQQYTNTFDVSGDFTAFKSYVINMTASAVGDLRPANDSTSRSITTNVNPVIDLGEPPNPIFSASFELDAGAGPYEYLWQDNITETQTFTAVGNGNYSVVVTDTVTGCIGGDATNLVFDIVDYSITNILGIGGSTCQGAENTVTVWVANLGNQNRTDAFVTIGHSINDIFIAEEDVLVAGIWLPGSSNAKSVVLSDPIAFADVGSSTLTVFVSNAGDVRPDNDARTKDVSVDPAPIVDFGGDTIHVSVPYTLDAGSHKSYLWQDNFDGRYYDVFSSNYLYTVTVTDEGVTCQTKRSVFVEPYLSVGQNHSDNLDLNIYPNPANDFLNIEAEVLNGKAVTIEIYNMANQLIWTDYHDGFGLYTERIDISNFDDGIYLLRFSNKEINHVQRFIIR
jgi:hypothetical protein